MDEIKYFIELIVGEIEFDLLYFLARIFGLALIVFSALSFQQKTQKNILIYQILCNCFGLLQLAVLSKYNGQYMGAILYFFAVFRAIIFYLGNKYKFAQSYFWVYLLSALYWVSYVLLFTVFGAEWNVQNAIVELLPIIGTIIMTFGFHCKNAKSVRIIYLIGTPFWIAYGVLIGATGTVVAEVLNVISILLGIIRFDIKSSQTNQ